MEKYNKKRIRQTYCNVPNGDNNKECRRAACSILLAHLDSEKIKNIIFTDETWIYVRSGYDKRGVWVYAENAEKYSGAI